MKSKDEIIHFFKASGLIAGQQFIDSLTPSIRLVPVPCSLEETTLGSSRMGGTPDLPEGFVWPTWDIAASQAKVAQLKSAGKRHLDFIAQINLKQVAGFGCAELLPKTGMLYFFYDIDGGTWGFDPKDAGSARVFYCDCDESQLLRVNAPHQAEAVLQPVLLDFAQDWTVDDCIRNPDDDFDLLFNTLENLNDDPPLHRLFGRPQVVQNPMELECELVSNGIYCGDPSGYQSPRAKSLEAGAADWRLLLQVDTDEENLGWMWGDGGRIYFWIREQDLRAKNFDRVWLVFQCS